MDDKPAKPKDERRGAAGPRAVAEVAARVTRKQLGKRGFAHAALVAGWPEIVGSALGGATLPLRIAFPRGERAGGVLHLRVASGALAVQLQHLEPLVIERVNGHFGYRAVAALAIQQGPVPQAGRKRAAIPAPAPAAEAVEAVARMLGHVDDPDIREALDRLGRRLAARW